ncbi:FecR family protein [Ferruginibacter sp. SUN106]|uniref:FecR family protein n=1 Tax=Ferruginibacter sp. SUN106 TaxID=2978348 RepID=UPI003D36C69C
MSKTALYNLLGRYLNNTCTTEERQMIDNLLELSEDNNIFASYTESDLNAIHSRIWEKIQEKTLLTEQPSIQPARPFYKMAIVKWAVAASVIGAIVFFAVRFNSNNGLSDRNNLTAAMPQSGMINKTNNTGKAISILLEDSTSVVIEPGTALNYPEHFSADKREVYLEGKAFFEVSKNAKRPFYIYHNNLITHVIGTSFTINTKKANKEVEVAVLTGRVEVSENQALLKNQKNKSENGVVLTPNQKVIYSVNTRMFVASLVEKPMPLMNKKPENFNFENEEMAKVLTAISKEYAIDIIAENENINKCTFTGNIIRQDLYSKLDFICKAINASYEIKGTTILIKGAGCE